MMYVGLGWETTSDFTQVLQEEEIRIRNNWGWGHYVNVWFYYMQLKRYFDTFNPNQIRVYLYEDLKANPMGILQDIFQFFNVDESFIPDITIKHNIFGIPKNNFLGALIKSVKPLNPILKQVFPSGIRQNIKNQILVKPQLLMDVRKQLIELDREDILNLQYLIHRDISKWLK